MVNQSFFRNLVATPLPDSGYTWTYASRLSNMLALVEEYYGKRDSDYTLLGFEFVDNHPQIWYPGNRKHIVIQIGLDCLTDTNRGCYQLAHEVIHLLSPTGGRKAPVIEEGLATYFAKQYLDEKMNQPNWNGTLPSYLEAQRLVEQLLAIDKNAIKVLRAEEPAFKAFTADLILKHYPALSAEVAGQLCSPFIRE